MLIKTILNKCHKLKSFVYKSVELAIYRGAEVLDITVVPRKNGLAICSGCHKPAPGYDRLYVRRFEVICQKLLQSPQDRTREAFSIKLSSLGNFPTPFNLSVR